MASKQKLRRNDPCHCGSGKKYKRCHGLLNSSTDKKDPTTNESRIKQLAERAFAQKMQRERQQGLGRPIISAEMKGQRLINVGSRFYVRPADKTRSFHDFLIWHFKRTIGFSWGAAESKQPPKLQHPIIQWLSHFKTEQETHATKHGEMFSAPMTGAIRAILNLAYNLYLIEHHIRKEEKKALSRLVKRLKNRAGFPGALYETYVAAAFLKAGFDLEYEDDRKGNGSHGEFFATHPETKTRFWVEAKARDRDTASSRPKNEAARLGVGFKLRAALKKDTTFPRIIFIDVNVPDLVFGEELTGWMRSAADQVNECQESLLIRNNPAPPAYVFVTNHPFHHHLEAEQAGYSVVALGFKIPDFGPDVLHLGAKALLESREKHRDVNDLFSSLTTHYEIPATFDGSIPEITFGAPTSVPPLKIGNFYVVPDADGSERKGELVEATVREQQQDCVGIYDLDDGRRVIVTTPLSADELSAYRKSPDTFFGVYRPNEKREELKSVTEAFDWLYDVYKNTPKNKLLEFMKDSSAIEELSKMSQKDLAIFYCERLAASMMSKSTKHQFND